jgi:alkanesulfonate monooxygenase SsuD/methylene tetrahydromethanopterin reductase-like flavin-dependent oxidoreductase (luciferase family)
MTPVKIAEDGAMAEARGRFSEVADIVLKAMREREFSYYGRFYKIPPTTIRPRPISHPEERFLLRRAESRVVFDDGKAELGSVVTVQRDWETTTGDIQHYRSAAREAGFAPGPPIIWPTYVALRAGIKRANLPNYTWD